MKYLAGLNHKRKLQEKGNIVIANFMNLNGAIIILDDGEPSEHKWSDPTEKGGGCVLLRYHESWDWLMPAVEKIEKLGSHNVVIEYHYGGIVNLTKGMNYKYKHSCHIWSPFHLPEIEKSYANTKMEAVWEQVVSFIKAYNERQKNKQQDNG